MDRLQHPGSIFYWPYVLSALLITLGYLVFARRLGPVAALRALLRRDVWLTRSTRTDVVLSAGYALLLSAPAVELQRLIYVQVNRGLGRAWFDAHRWPWPLRLPPSIEGLAAALWAMLAIDLGTYVAHRLLHRLPWLWALHAVHHSAAQLTPFTTHRQHPLEPLLLNAVRGAFAAAALTLFYCFFPGRTPATLIMGLGAGFFVYMFTVNLQHSHVPVQYPRWLRRLVLSPHIHHLHHSAAAHHRDRNFGVVFPYWDRLLGTYLDEDIEAGGLRFGLGAAEDPFGHSILRCYLQPLYTPLVRLAQLAGRRRETPTLYE